MWLQHDFGDGPVIDGRPDQAVRGLAGVEQVPGPAGIQDKTMPLVMVALDVTLRRIGGAPSYVLTDNEKDRHDRAHRWRTGP